MRELSLEVADETAASVRSDVEAAITAKTGTLWLTDRDGRQIACLPPNLPMSSWVVPQTGVSGFLQNSPVKTAPQLANSYFDV